MPNRELDKVADPAAGSERTWMPTGAPAALLHKVRYEAVANDGALRVGLQINDDDGDEVWQVKSQGTASSGTTQTITAQVGSYPTAASVADTVHFAVLPVYIKEGWELSTLTEGLSATDQLQNFRIEWEKL